MQRSVYIRHTGVMLLIISFFSGCASMNQPSQQTYQSGSTAAPYNKPYKVKGATYYPLKTATGYREEGIASWYGSESGDRTAMGTRFLPQNLTAAHKTLPLPSRVRVTNLSNGRSVEVLVNDRGPFKGNRLIDLSHGAAKKIGLHGLTKVRIEHLDTRISLK
ncbi:MAG: septal ring lytic transglycosylase RlpA family protein [Pseudomonadota bacterium]